MNDPEVLRLVNSAFPTLRLTRKRNLTLLTYAILRKRTLCQAKPSLSGPGPGIAKHHHKKKRLHRFGTNEGVRPLTLSLQLIPTIMKRFGFGRGQVAVNLDRTPLRAREQALFTSLPLRGLPLFWATSFAQIRSGTSQNDRGPWCAAWFRPCPKESGRCWWPTGVSGGRGSYLLFLQGVR
jgi:hypothetical protein